MKIEHDFRVPLIQNNRWRWVYMKSAQYTLVEIEFVWLVFLCNVLSLVGRVLYFILFSVWECRCSSTDRNNFWNNDSAIPYGLLVSNFSCFLMVFSKTKSLEASLRMEQKSGDWILWTIFGFLKVFLRN